MFKNNIEEDDFLLNQKDRLKKFTGPIYGFTELCSQQLSQTCTKAYKYMPSLETSGGSPSYLAYCCITFPCLNGPLPTYGSLLLSLGELIIRSCRVKYYYKPRLIPIKRKSWGSRE